MLHAGQQTRFSLAIDGFHSDLQVLSFTGAEAISQPYRWLVELVSETPDIDLESLLHKPAFLQLDQAGNGIHGQVYQAGQSDPGRRLHHYRIVLVPCLAYLGHRINQRIFQQMSAPQIIAALLQGHGVQGDAFRFCLGTPCPVREYCVQYDESDLHFLQRLCEEEGIHYHFEHSPQGHLLVFGDDQVFFPRLERPMAYAQDSGLVADEPVVSELAMRFETRTSRVVRRDYDFQHPRLLLEAGFGPEPSAAEQPQLEDYDYPGHFTDRARGRQLSQWLLQRHRADYCQMHGRSNDSRLASGHLLTLAEHPREQWNGLWLLTEVTHEGHQPQVLEESRPAHSVPSAYHNHFLATPADVIHRPPLLHEKPRVLGQQTAVVTGPEGEEIHCDEHGRVKVQFFWDREGQGDAASSCWLRVASGWAGQSLGGLAIPRVGMEVLVDFLEGDPDQPVISGCLYHGEHPTPYPLPEHKTRSVLKTRSSPGGGGFNEVRVEDKAGQEQVFVHAQRDWEQGIERDQKVRVGNQRHDTVVADSYSHFHAEEHRTTLGDRKTELKASDHLVVGHSQHLKAGHAHLLQAGSEIHIKAGQQLVIEAGQELTVNAGGSFIRLDASGVTLSGAQVRVSDTGTPEVGSGVAVLMPLLPRALPPASAGLAPVAPVASPPSEPEPPARQYALAIRLFDVPGEGGFPLGHSEWQVLQGEQVLLEGVSDESGRILLDEPQRQRLCAAVGGDRLWLCYAGQRIPLLLQDVAANADHERLALTALDFHDCLQQRVVDATCQTRGQQDGPATQGLYQSLEGEGE